MLLNGNLKLALCDWKLSTVQRNKLPTFTVKQEADWSAEVFMKNVKPYVCIILYSIIIVLFTVELENHLCHVNIFLIQYA